MAKQKTLPPNHPKNPHQPNDEAEDRLELEMDTTTDSNLQITEQGDVIYIEDKDTIQTRYFVDTDGKLKIKPRVHISSKGGFDKLLSSLEVIRHLRRGGFTMSEIDTESFKSFHSDLEKITNFCRKMDVTIPVEVDGMVDAPALLNHYKSDVFSELGVEYVDSKVLIQKYDEQRIRNTGPEKTMDNFRYAILRAFSLASANQFPYGIRLDSESNNLLQYDNSNLFEFLTLNSHPFLNKDDLNMNEDGLEVLKDNVTYDTLDKDEVRMVIDEIRDSFEVSYPAVLDNFLKDIENDPASTRYKIQDIIGKNGVKELVEKYQSVHILIGYHDVISKELESLNNKNNPWLNINFVYQKIKQRTNVSFVVEAKLALRNTDYSDTLEYFSDLVDKAPEYSLIPVIAFDIFSKSSFRLNSGDEFVNFESLAYLMQGMRVRFLLDKYESIVDIPDFDYDLVDILYSDDALEVWKSFSKKLTRLKKVIKHLKKKGLKTQTKELTALTPSKIDGLKSNQFGYNTLATLALIFAGNGKTLKNDPANVVKAVELFLDTYFGDSVFTVDETKYEYVIKDSQFAKLLTDTDYNGFSNSHIGRAEYFISDKLETYKQKYLEYEDYQGTNEERSDKHIAELIQITNTTKFGWFEDTTSGKTVYCGYDATTTDDKGLPQKDNVSWEHIKNNKQTHGAIRANETNSGDGAKTKVFKTTSEYYEYILEQQDAPKVKKEWKDGIGHLMCKLLLEKVVNHYKDEEKRHKHEEMKEGLGLK